MFRGDPSIYCKAHRIDQLRQRLELGPGFDDQDLVFPTQLGTPTRYGNLDRRHFKKIIRQANEKIRQGNEVDGVMDPELPTIRLYDLRHTMATLLLSKGVNPKIVSERLGHASITLTLDTYSHVLPTRQPDATQEIERLLFGT
ncbi:MAG: tyrosine-type recombinase/integrase [Chloracidobacterium sp.]|nr:tyrosine-type recombinase/integrase [Chloracidobacterium sp.]